MSVLTRLPSRRRLVAVTAALLFAGAMGVSARPSVAAGTAATSDYYRHYTYYYDSAKTQVAGHGMYDCYDEYEQLDGEATQYSTLKLIPCGPHDHE